MLAYVKQSRTWLSIKQGKCSSTPFLKSVPLLLFEFGDAAWYGPIQDSDASRKWYIRTYRIKHYFQTKNDEEDQLKGGYIRWTVIAEVSHNYVALSWDGFSFNQLENDHIDDTQFAFWSHIPIFFDELADFCQANWVHPNLHNLVMDDMWSKYLGKSAIDSDYKWQHWRVRTEADGVAMNAHSSGAAQKIVKGLQTFARHLAEVSLKPHGLSNNIDALSISENEILNALLKERGTKSYEFSLDRQVYLNEASTQGSERQVQTEHLFKAHCYFGLKPFSKTQDSLQHLKCYKKLYGGSTGVLEFLVRELGLQG
ncbi:MAG: hypothetical protein NHB32_27260 [Fischerella sp. CENA71]|nr:hypothetical protein [Fischerella sp. CENA71]